MTDTRKHMTRAQAYAVAKTIEAAGKANGDVWIYAEGWSDERIAKLHQVSEHAVKYQRKELFGRLPAGNGGAGSPLSLAWDRIKDLEARVAALEDAATKPQRTPLLDHLHGNGKVMR